jgi:hypothetical protein
LWKAEDLRLCSKDGLSGIWVDPGRKFPFAAIRDIPAKPHQDPPNLGQTRQERRKISSRKAWKKYKEEATGRTSVKMSYKQWQELTGSQRSMKKVQKWRARKGYDSNDKEALAYSGKSRKLSDYVEWLKFRARSRNQRWKEQAEYHPRYERKNRFQQKQRALAKATRLLTAGNKDYVIVWGAGSVNAPAVKGLPLACNKGLYKQLALNGYTVVISNEFRSSKDCSRCEPGVDVYHPRRRWSKIPFCNYCGCNGKKRGASGACSVCMAHPCKTCRRRHRKIDRVVCCKQCKGMWHRDTAACPNIERLFWKTVIWSRDEHLEPAVPTAGTGDETLNNLNQK